MPSFTVPSFRAPFGQNEYLRSTRGKAYESYMCAAATVPAVTVDTATDQKILQPGVVIAAVTSGASTGLYGPYMPGGVATEVVTIPVDATGGTFTITVDSGAVDGTTTALAFNATAAQVQAALELLASVDPGDLKVTGGPGSAGGTTPYVITWNPLGPYAGVDAPTVTTTPTLTGGASTATPATSAGGQTGPATDGRGDPDNIVGINDTFLPWQLMERDVEIAAVYEATAVQAWCIELDAGGLPIALTNTTADAMRGVKGLDVHFK